MTKKKEIVSFILYICLFYLVLELLGTTCPIKWLTGISCGGCGMTRAIIALIKGDFNMAMYYHPLCLLLPVVLLTYLLRNKMPSKVYKCIMILVLIAFVVCYFIRLFDPNNDVVVCDIKDSIVYRILKGE